MATPESDGTYSCNICSKTFHLQSMYACYHGHYLCRKCYKQIYYRGKDKRCCPHSNCTAFLVDSQENKSEPLETTRKMFPNPYIFSENRPQATGSIISLASMYRPSLLSLGYSSKKPVHCPHNGCNKTIAVSSLDSHFEHDHEHVATISTNLETRNGLDFYFKDLYGNIKTLCLVIIHIEPRDGEDSFGESNAPADHLLTRQRSVYSKFSQFSPPTKPFFIVMVAKVTAGDNSIMDDDELDLLASGFSPIDRIIFYVSSNIPTTYSYTIAVSTPDQGIRAKYYGPLLSVNEDYVKLCEDGKGLIFNHNHVDGMSDGGTKNVCLDVIIHERGDETYDSD